MHVHEKEGLANQKFQPAVFRESSNDIELPNIDFQAAGSEKKNAAAPREELKASIYIFNVVNHVNQLFPFAERLCKLNLSLTDFWPWLTESQTRHAKLHYESFIEWNDELTINLHTVHR